MKQFNYKCTVAKNGMKMYYQKVGGKWKRISNTVGKNAEKGKRRYNSNKVVPLTAKEVKEVKEKEMRKKLKKDFEKYILPYINSKPTKFFNIPKIKEFIENDNSYNFRIDKNNDGTYIFKYVSDGEKEINITSSFGKGLDKIINPSPV